jgi:hypothetical protein
VQLTDREAKIDISQVDERQGHPEFRAYAWMSLTDLLSKAAPFRLPVYRPLVEYVQTVTRT